MMYFKYYRGKVWHKLSKVLATSPSKVSYHKTGCGKVLHYPHSRGDVTSVLPAGAKFCKTCAYYRPENS